MGPAAWFTSPGQGDGDEGQGFGGQDQVRRPQRRAGRVRGFPALVRADRGARGLLRGDRLQHRLPTRRVRQGREQPRLQGLPQDRARPLPEQVHQGRRSRRERPRGAEREASDGARGSQELRRRHSFEGMIGLAGEIVKKKIASEEETWSGQSLLIFDSNWDGILSQAKPFYEPAGKSPKLKELGTKVEDAIKDAKKCIDKYRKVGTTTTYDDYSTMPVNGLVDGRECVVKQGYAVMQALVDLAKEVGVFDDCSPFHHNSVYTYRHEGEHPKGETGGV